MNPKGSDADENFCETHKRLSEMRNSLIKEAIMEDKQTVRCNECACLNNLAEIRTEQ